MNKDKKISAFQAMIEEKASKIKLGHASCREKASEAFRDMRAYSKAGHDKALKDAKKIGFKLANKKDAKWDKLDPARKASMLKALNKVK